MPAGQAPAIMSESRGGPPHDATQEPGDAGREGGAAGVPPPASSERLPVSSGIRSLDRAVAILGVFDEAHPRLSLSDIAEALNLNTSTTHRLLQSLKAHGFVTQPDGGKSYALGPTLLRLARLATGALDVQEIARPSMRRLRDAVGETVGLHVLRSDLVRIVVDQAESHQALRRSYTELGEAVPLHQGAPGKVLLAFLPPDLREQVLSGPLAAANENTIIEPDALRADLAKIRTMGFATSFGERVGGIHTVAVPLVNDEGRTTAALSVTGPAMRMPRERLEAIAKVARATAREISTRLGYRGPWKDDE